MNTTANYKNPQVVGFDKFSEVIKNTLNMNKVEATADVGTSL